jgi:hypothetical protein
MMAKHTTRVGNPSQKFDADKDEEEAVARVDGFPLDADEEVDEMELTNDGRVDAEEADALLDQADDAVNSMEAHERRRDATYRTGGDDHDPGINEEIDDNAPKDKQLPLRKRSENQT